MKRLCGILALVVVAFILAATLPWAAAVSPAPRAAAYEAVFVGCTVRLPSTAGPAILDDAAHHPLGCTGVSLDATGQVVITYPPMAEVITGFAQADECLVDAGAGVDLGPSIGLAETKVKLTQNGVQVRGDSPGLVGPSCNLFFGAHFLAEVA